MSDDLIKRSAAIRALNREKSDWNCDYNVPIDNCIKRLNKIKTADRPQGEFTRREYEQFLHGISLSLLSKRSAQYWGYEEKTAQKIRWLEALEQKVRAKMKGADDE